MSQSLEFNIEPYSHSHDAGLAAMWNASDQQWPGGFTKGVPMTAERVADWMDKQVTLMRLVVTSPTGEVVAYGSLWDEPSQRGRSCYVDLLNVHPDYQARSLCRRMLTSMVDYATEHGYPRMTIGTWSANLKAVPLYKKVGFQWKPNTTVYMENYIPLLRQLPILRDFFAQADWYTHHSRALLQVEDNAQHPKTGDTEVYLYRWTQPNGAWIEAVIDRKAQTLTGLETADFAVYARVAESRPAQGISYPIVWEINNKRATPLPVRLVASGDARVQIDHTADFTLAPGEVRTITASYRCAGDAPQLDISHWRPQPTPQVTTWLLLDEDELSLGSGLHYEPAAAITTHPSPITLVPGVAQTILVQVKNQLDRPMQGELQIVTAAGLTTNWQRTIFQADALGHASAALELKSEHADEIALAVVATFVDEGQLITTAPQPLPVLVRSLGQVAAIAHHPDPAKTTVYVENDFFFGGCIQREGRMWLANKAGEEYEINLQEMLGPPYTPYEFEQKDYAITLHKTSGRVEINLTIDSTNFPGVQLGRQIIVSSSPLVEVRQWLHNTGAMVHTCKVLTSLHLPDNFAVNGQTAMPRRERLVTAMSNLIPEVEGDFPKLPAELAEQWIAHANAGLVHGVVWHQDVTEHEWRPWFFDLFSAQHAILPHQRVDLSPIYLYCGPGDWRTVRRIWQQGNGETSAEQLENRAMPAEAGPQLITLTPNPVLTLGDTATVQLYADNVRKQAIDGRLQITPPAGWHAEPAMVAVEALQEGKTIAATIQLHADNPPVGAATGQLTLQTVAFDSQQPFTILRVGDTQHAVNVTPDADQGSALWQIDNGRMTWRVAPDFHAGIVAWHERGSPINQLCTSFPDEGEFKWMKPWFGGLRPLLTSNEGGWPGKFDQETFAATVIEARDAQGLPWRGVRLQTEIRGQKSLKGIRAELDYLTLPGSNLIKAVLRVVNDTPVYRSAWNPSCAFMLFCQVDGRFDNAVLYGENPYAGLVQRKRAATGVWIRVGNWGAVVNPASGRTLCVACPNPSDSVLLLDGDKEGGHLLITQQKPLTPNAAKELVVYAALVDSLDAARQYAGLGG